MLELELWPLIMQERSHPFLTISFGAVLCCAVLCCAVLCCKKNTFYRWTSDKQFFYVLFKSGNIRLCCMPSVLSIYISMVLCTLPFAGLFWSTYLSSIPSTKFFSAHIFNKLFFWLLWRQPFFHISPSPTPPPPPDIIKKLDVEQTMNVRLIILA